MGEPDEAAAISGEIVKRPAEVAAAPPAADMRYTDDSAVARVFIRVEYADGRIREYQAREPQDFKINNPESMSSASMALRPSPLSLPAGGGFHAVWSGVPVLRMSFTAHPKHNLHVRTERTAPEDFPGITYG